MIPFTKITEPRKMISVNQVNYTGTWQDVV